MADTTLPGLLSTGDHASRPAASAVGTGALYSCTDHGLVYQTDGSSWTTWASLGGGGSLYPIDNRTVHATYGDHFTAASLNTSLWTRRNYTSGAETYQVGASSTYLRITTASRSNGDGYFQTAPAGDFTVEMKYIPRLMGQNYPNLGPCIIDSSGNGVVAMVYAGSPLAILLLKVTTYTSYGSAYVQPGGGVDNIGQMATWLNNERPLWLRVRKSSNNYYLNYSMDGEAWGVESSALAYTITVDRIGFMHAPLGTANVSATIPNRFDIDWFDVV